MRFFATGEQNRQLLLNSVILMFLGYILLLWMTNALMYFHKMDLSYASVVSYYLGSEENFTQPKGYQSLLEVLHFHMFAMGLLVLTLTHLMLMTQLSVMVKVSLNAAIYLATIMNEAASWLIVFVHPHFAYLKITSFIVLELSLLALIISVSVSLFYARRKMQNT